MQLPANMPLERTCHDSAMKQVSMVFQFHNMLILHPPIMPIPPMSWLVAAVEDAIGAIPGAVAVIAAMFIVEVAMSMFMFACVVVVKRVLMYSM